MLLSNGRGSRYSRFVIQRKWNAPGTFVNMAQVCLPWGLVGVEIVGGCGGSTDIGQSSDVGAHTVFWVQVEDIFVFPFVPGF